MHNFKYIISGILWILWTIQVTAQGLKIGERCPEIVLNKILNYQPGKMNLFDLKGRAVVLDFWSSWCQNCIEAFPRLDSIQNILKDQVQIILVTSEKKQNVIKLFNRYKLLAKIKLISVVEDTVLHLLFPHNGVPYQIWLDKDGIVKAITDGQNTTIENLNLLANGNELPHLNSDIRFSTYQFGSDAPIIAGNYEKNKRKIFYYSYFSAYRAELTSGFSIPRIDTSSATIRISATNVTIDDLYGLAFRRKNTERGDVVVRLFDDTTKLLSNPSTKENIYCYELITKDTVPAHALEKMKCDLDRQFNITSRRLKIPLECLILKRISGGEQIASNSKLSPVSYKQGDFIKFENVRFSVVVNSTLSRMVKLPLIDETGYTDRVNMKLPSHFENLEKYNDYLAKYGLSLIKDNRIFDAICLMDK